MVVSAALALSAFAQDNKASAFSYKSGYTSIEKLGVDLYKALSPKDRALINPRPISIETEAAPYVKMLFYPDDTKPIRGIWISMGFIDLVNHIAHAKAIDTVKKGYFKDYIQRLGKETGKTELQPLPGIENPAYWTDDMLNEQLSNFNSIVGIVAGVELAHHYLGHFEKYKDKLDETNAKAVPINTLLTQKEWDAAFEKGVKDALNAGCAIEGVIPFYEAFDKMQPRPSWAIHFFPENVKFPKVKKELERLQKRFFAGQE